MVYISILSNSVGSKNFHLYRSYLPFSLKFDYSVFMILFKILFLCLPFFLELISFSYIFLTKADQISASQLNNSKTPLKMEKNNIFPHSNSILKIKKGDAKKAAVSLYNQGVIALNKGEKDKAQLVFEKSFYNYMYFPAYKALKFMENPATLTPLVWHVTMGIYGLISFIFVFLLVIKKTSLRVKIKVFAIWFLSVIFIFSFYVLALKPTGRALKAFKLKNAPLEGAFSIGSQEKGEPFQALKLQGIWVKIKTSQKQKGWTLKENLYFTRD